MSRYKSIPLEERRRLREKKYKKQIRGADERSE